MDVGNLFRERFGTEPQRLRSPGRINIIGEHTDYNDGFVLPAAIDMEVDLAVGANGTPGTCRLYAVDLDESATLQLDRLESRMEPYWANYLAGVAGIMRKQDLPVGGFDLVFSSTIPVGAGLSSSAAIECGTALALNHLFDLGLSKERLVRMAQQAEHHYAGVLCGIMDQFASMMGKAGEAILLDCRTLDFQYVPMRLGDFTWVLCDSGVKHALANSAYNTRREECEEAVNRLRRAFPQMEALRDITLDMLEAEDELLPPELMQRARHVVSENQRTLMARAALKAGDMEDLGDLLYDSHQSLQYDYEVSCPELDMLVDVTRPWSYVSGARMMGGGFGGCSLNLVREGYRETFVKDIREAYLKAYDRELAVYPVTIAEGTTLAPSD